MIRSFPTFIDVKPGQTGKLIGAVGPWILEGLEVYCLDGGNVFNPLPLARWLTGQGREATTALERRVFVSRAYTCHQLATAARRLLAPLAIHRTPCLALITGIETMFLDEDIPQFERRYLFDQTLHEACALATQGVPVLITHAAGAPNAWTRRIAAAAKPLRGIENLLPDLKSPASSRQGD